MQPPWHAADKLLERAVLLACLLLAVTLQQLGRPLLALTDTDLPAHNLVRLLTFSKIAAKPCPYSLDRIEVPRNRGEPLAMCFVHSGCPVTPLHAHYSAAYRPVLLASRLEGAAPNLPLLFLVAVSTRVSQTFHGP